MDKFKIDKSAKMYVYLPCYLKNPKTNRKEYQKMVTKKIPFSRVEVGDLFITKKRDVPRDLLKDDDDMKVEKVKRSMIDGSCIVILEKMVFETPEDLKEFLKKQTSVI